jgi:N-acetylmuramoyl-L-alanine amidase
MSLILDAGHGGVDPGAIGNGIREEDYTLNISLYQYKRFKELGIPVKLTRSSDTDLDSNKRSKIVRESGMKHCISNHINAGGGDGAEVIYSIHSKPTFAQIVLDELVRAGQNKRKIFTRTSNGNDYYYMHRMTGNVETIIVEYGFLDSKKDDIIQLKNDWDKYAEAVVKGYCAYAGYKYVPKGGTPMSTSDGRFTDVPKKHTYHDAIEEVFKAGLMQGYGDGRFGVDDNLTRGQFAVVLAKLLKQKG